MILIFQSSHMMILTTLYFILLTTSTLVAKPIAQNTLEHDIDPRSYLQSYGYLEEPRTDTNAPPSLSSPTNNDSFRSAIKTFQQFMGLNVTGVVDEATKQQMRRPRCGLKDTPRRGVKDTPISLQNGPTEDDFPDSSKWNKSFLSYRFGSFASYKQISRPLQESIVDDAFYEWAKHVPLTFEKVCETCSADIVIDFIDDGVDEHRDNGEKTRFPSEVVAHAALPGRPYPPFIHFNKKYIFTDSYNFTAARKNLFHVAVHEIGHTLGLLHDETNVKSVMVPGYPEPYNRTRADYLPSIDQQALQKKYGKRDESIINSCSIWSTWPQHLENDSSTDSKGIISLHRKHDTNTVETNNVQQLLIRYMLRQRQSYRMASHRLREQSSTEKPNDSSLSLGFLRGRTDVLSILQKNHFKKSGTVIADKFGETKAICYDRFDNLYVSDYANNRVLKYPTDATKQPRTIVAESLNTPRGLYVTNDGNTLYVADNKGVHRFKLNEKQRILGASSLLFFLESSSEIHCMIVDEDDFNTIYLYDATRRRIQRCRHYLHNWQCETIINLTVDNGDLPQGVLMAFDAKGDLLLLVETTKSVIFQYKHDKNGCRSVSTSTRSPPSSSTTPKNDDAGTLISRTELAQDYV